MSRRFVHSVLTQPEIQSWVQGRVFQESSVLTGQLVKPFIVYRMGNYTDEGMSDPDSLMPGRQFFQIYIYDETGDYSRIDDIIQDLKRVFLRTPPSGDVCGTVYLETSGDLDDVTLQANMRYVRFQLAKSR